MRNAFILMLAVPMAITGCKKKTETEPMVEEPAPPPEAEPELVWTWGAAAYEGGHMADSVGTLTVPLTIVNASSGNAIVRSWSLGVQGAEGRVCVSTGEEVSKASGGNNIELTFTADCMYTKLPAEGDTVQLSGVIEYGYGGEELKMSVEETVSIAR